MGESLAPPFNSVGDSLTVFPKEVRCCYPPWAARARAPPARTLSDCLPEGSSVLLPPMGRTSPGAARSHPFQRCSNYLDASGGQSVHANCSMPVGRRPRISGRVHLEGRTE